ncbi:putative mitochondrial Leucine-rich repeat protein [Leptomonas pyrrhocoris]|uniref:Putative mitochondrial Leucine-rich repeat protein n=1 Tax=Leptomonas pyrrhocoris TaxID=157538 RepID=A0A0M9G5V8_LEPPY|nr:putative mitochondrial Leucine-rich repeat protein [Leptomonas pyrrhocoris]XP_015661416.1 putative mitochondrial Leucine-rich repeat protein [Leptomonas pyrrhocoris]KPA82976.1 putative mitochondrial Leucine-rich repeat protein [Leptomonas pyrrhocoris]KPA82977.1 putative mitochondrial Leucine-rich repeat protein [Leptomonas pyrrhocoris]|eukprot:XP_015661415.1 putative mitochondrial Leucine-rich repeat protein [Leptomonas pyrrhocoris]
MTTMSTPRQKPTVEFTYGQLTQEVLEAMIVDPAGVTAVDLSGNNISSDECIELVRRYISKMINLDSLDLKDNKIGPQGAMYLFDALRENCPNLTFLDVNENAIQDEALYPLALLLQSAKLRTLNVVTNHITPRGLPTLCDGVVACPTLTELSLAFNLLGDEGGILVAQMLSNHPSLTALDLSDNRIGDGAAVAIADAFILSYSSRLASLNLSVNHMGDLGFQALAEALTKTNNRHFSTLDLACNDAVTDVGRAAIVKALPHMRHVYSIDLTSCDLSDENAKDITAAIHSSRTSVGVIEWYNNPRIQLATEKALYEAIEAKAAAAHARHPLNSDGSLFLCAGVAVTAAMVVASILLRRQQKA